jgi:hypothetical protein
MRTEYEKMIGKQHLLQASAGRWEDSTNLATLALVHRHSFAFGGNDTLTRDTSAWCARASVCLSGPGMTFRERRFSLLLKGLERSAR